MLNISNLSFDVYVPYKNYIILWSYGVPLSTHTTVAVHKLITFIDFRSAMFLE